MNVKLKPGNPGDVGMSGQRVQHIVDLARGWVADGITPALVILVARKGTIVIHEAFGRLTPEDDSPPLEPDTLFPLSSLVKPITATAAMILVEEGLLGLNRPVSWYIHEFTGEGKQAVMVHNLLTHTSGFRWQEVEPYAENRKGDIEVLSPAEDTQHPLIHEYLCLRYGAPLWKPPGTEMSYYDYNYELLGEIVRRISGRSFAEFAREQILEPLGMEDTHYIAPDSLYPRIVRRPADVPYPDINEWAGQGQWASGGAFSTAKDMAVFGHMFLCRGIYGDARILSPASVAEMTRNQIPGIAARYGDEFLPEASWGLGWGVLGYSRYGGTLRSASAFCHGGGGGVFLWVDPIYEIVGVCFSVQTVEDPRWVHPFMDTVTAAVVV